MYTRLFATHDAISHHAVPAHIAHDEMANIVVTVVPNVTPATSSEDFVIIEKTMNGLRVCTSTRVTPAASVS